MNNKTNTPTTADDLIIRSCDEFSEKLRTEVIAIIGEKHVIMRKIELGLPLFTSDYAYILTHLS